MASPITRCLLSFFISFFLNTFSFASDHIFFNNSLSGSMTIISQGGKFELGFIQLGNRSLSPRYYLGIWYKRVPQTSPVWIANRNTPFSDPNTSVLRISTDGNLVLLDQNKTLIWSTNLTTLISNSTICTLLDTGNLVLRYSSDSTANLLWQSMDYPTDTWLPGGKLGRNKVIGRQKLISWKNSDDPAEGTFSVEIDPNGTSQYFIFWNRSKPFWSSGLWNGKFFENVPEMNAISDNNKSQHFFKYVSNENETYFSYSAERFLISRYVMDTNGQTKYLAWLESSKKWMLLWTQPQAQCDVYALCGPFGTCNEKKLPYCSCIKGFGQRISSNWQLGDFTGGCTRNSPLQCEATNGSMPNGQTDKFFAMSSIILPDKPHSLYTNSVEDCERACLQNCSCNAYAYSNNCSLWYGDVLNLREESDGSSGVTIFVRLAAFEFMKDHQRKMTIWALITSVLGSLACGIVIFLLVRRYQWKKLVLSMNASEIGLVVFRYGDLRRMTNNFSERLGRGSFGSVFKGRLPNSSAVAVKKLESIVEVGEKQFRNEVRTIGIIQHINLVRLRGFCSEGIKKLLIYEYMPNGSLDKQLFQRNSSHLNWNMRYQIALGAARGLAYLHESCVECIIHCDIKPENILLDEFFVPKIADFGMAKLVGRDFSRVITALRGTIGYLAPEWISGLPISAKIDVYSYGLVLLELISGKRNTEQLEGESVGYFPLLASIELKEGNILALLDPNLNGDANLGEVERVCRIACWCIQEEEQNRPAMGQVVQILEGSLEVTMPPIPRSLKALAEHPGSLNFFEEHPLGDGIASTVTDV